MQRRLTMAILGIENRTENFRTAEHFAQFMQTNGHSLLDLLGVSTESSETETSLELFWKGMRDFLHNKKHHDNNERLAEVYDSHFLDLRREVQCFRTARSQQFANLEDWNYDASTPERRKMLRDNLVNTEIDVVLETEHCLYIGEAKHLMRFGADRGLVLVHQLVRQYVMATILMDIWSDENGGRKKKIVPFVIGASENFLQVQFMRDSGRMLENHIVTWDQIANLEPKE